MNSDAILLRLEKIRIHYDLSAAALADKIKVQRSSISHLLKGRNKPSLEFVIKLVAAFPEIDIYWFLYGIGNFPSVPTKDTSTTLSKKKEISHSTNNSITKQVDRMVIFYTDGTFKSYEKE